MSEPTTAAQRNAAQTGEIVMDGESHHQEQAKTLGGDLLKSRRISAHYQAECSRLAKELEQAKRQTVIYRAELLRLQAVVSPQDAEIIEEVLK